MIRAMKADILDQPGMLQSRNCTLFFSHNKVLYIFSNFFCSKSFTVESEIINVLRDLVITDVSNRKTLEHYSFNSRTCFFKQNSLLTFEIGLGALLTLSSMALFVISRCNLVSSLFFNSSFSLKN